MTWQCTIGGIDYSSRVQFQTVQITRSNMHRGGMCTFDVEITSKSLKRPLCFQQVVISRTSDGARLFGGIIQRVEQLEAMLPSYTYRVTCSDFTRWLDHYPVGPVSYPDATRASAFPSGQIPVSEIVKQILADSVTTTAPNTSLADTVGPSVPITYDGISLPQSGVTMAAGTFNVFYQPVSQAIDVLAKQVNALWFVDEYAKLWFLTPDVIYSVPSGTTAYAPLSPQSVAFYNQDLGNGSEPTGFQTVTIPTLDADNPYNNVPAGQSTLTTYRNLVLAEEVQNTISAVTLNDFMLAVNNQAVEDGATNNTSLKGDGITTFYTLYNMPVDPAHTTVNLSNGTTYTVGNGNLKTEYIDGRPETPSKDAGGNLFDWCFVCQSNQGIRFNKPVPNGVTIKVTYNYYQQHSQDVQKNLALAAEIARREGFGAGMYYLTMSGDQVAISPVTLAQGTPAPIAAELIALNRYGRIRITASFESRLFGWRPGQLFGIVSNARGDSYNPPTYQVWGNPFSERFFVTQVQTQILNDTEVLHKIDAATDLWGS